MRIAISKAFGFKLSYKVKANTEVPVGREKLDTLTAFTFDYLFLKPDLHWS